MTDRALRYHDKAVQENWHASESMKIMMTSEHNFAEGFSESDRKVFRKRVVSMILATDMAEHMSQVNLIDFKVKHKGITRELQNGSKIIETENSADKFSEQQKVLDFLVHACDLSTPTRKFDTLKEWTYLLFDEFFI